jgi:hypothetical protein
LRMNGRMEVAEGKKRTKAGREREDVYQASKIILPRGMTKRPRKGGVEEWAATTTDHGRGNLLWVLRRLRWGVGAGEGLLPEHPRQSR